MKYFINGYEQDDLTWSCSCPDYIFRRKKEGSLCKHLIHIKEQNKEQIEQKNKSVDVDKILKEFRTGMSAILFIDKYGNDVLELMKQRFDVIEEHGKIIKL